MMRKPSTAIIRDIRIPVEERVGSFRYFRAEDRWEWSNAVAHMHGYPDGQIQPTTALVLSHKHADDASDIALLIDAVAGQGQPFSSRHRIVDTHGRTHPVLVIGDRLCDDDGAVIGSQGFFVDLSDFDDDTSIDAAIADFTAHRALIEQAKGILMLTYGISAEQAFDILVWRSQETNVKLRNLVLQIIEDFRTQIHVPREVRERADHLVLTAHRRVHTAASPLDAASDAC